jgi:hypothetical protein
MYSSSNKSAARISFFFVNKPSTIASNSILLVGRVHNASDDKNDLLQLRRSQQMYKAFVYEQTGKAISSILKSLF